MEDIILEFWNCSLKSDFSEFDWDNAFDTYYPYLERNCIEHGQCEFEQYLEWMDELYGLDTLEESVPDWTCSYKDNNFWYYSKYDAMINMIRCQYESLKENYATNIHGENAKLLEKIDNRDNLTEPELIQLFDSCIHSEHINGNILEDIDIDSLREQVEKDWKDEQKFVTNIRDFI